MNKLAVSAISMSILYIYIVTNEIKMIDVKKLIIKIIFLIKVFKKAVVYFKVLCKQLIETCKKTELHKKMILLSFYIYYFCYCRSSMIQSIILSFFHKQNLLLLLAFCKSERFYNFSSRFKQRTHYLILLKYFQTINYSLFIDSFSSEFTSCNMFFNCCFLIFLQTNI